MERERARGALLGLAVGDALGTTQEFERKALVRPWRLLEGPQRDIVGGGPFRVVPGQVTDDTHMAICLARSLWGREGFDPQDVLRRYAGWLPHAFDVGSLTSSALARAATDPEPGRKAWELTGRQSAGNGSLMRTAPIGVYFWNDVSGRRRASLADSALTHFDPRCQLACAAFNAAIARAVGLDTGQPAFALWQAADLELHAAAEALRTDYPDLEPAIDGAEEALRADLLCAMQHDPDLWDMLHAAQGFVRVAFRLAFWELLNAPDFEAGLIDVANRGGDADTNAAIAGALLGAFHGETAIPSRWTKVVLGAVPAGGGPLASDYHPRAMLETFERPAEVREDAEDAEDDEPGGQLGSAANRKFFALEPERQLRLVWEELIGEGALDWDDAIRRAARGLRARRILEFARLRDAGALYQLIARLIERDLRAEDPWFDRPARGKVRAVTTLEGISRESWREFVISVVGDEPTDREDVIRAAAERAREVVGLSFKRLRMDGAIAKSIRSAINGAVRRREIGRAGRRLVQIQPGTAAALVGSTTEDREEADELDTIADRHLDPADDRADTVADDDRADRFITKEGDWVKVSAVPDQASGDIEELPPPPGEDDTDPHAWAPADPDDPDPIAAELEASAVLRARVPDAAVRAQVIAALAYLLRRGGVASAGAFAAAIQEWEARVAGVVARLQEILNIDAYDVVLYDRETREVRLDRAKLARQLHLTD